VTSQVEGEHTEAAEPFFREPAEAEPVRDDAVEADDRRPIRVAPFVHVQHRGLENHTLSEYRQCMTVLARAQASPARRSPDPRARPVLVVEDDIGVREYLVSVLRRQGYRVIAAASGEEALGLLGKEPALLAVLDVTLPGMDGFAVVEELAPDVPVIIVTGDPVGAYARTAGRTKRFQVLPKPVASELLEHAVAAAL
jgi:CheY-like chemotaxis protein